MATRHCAGCDTQKGYTNRPNSHDSTIAVARRRFLAKIALIPFNILTNSEGATKFPREASGDREEALASGGGFNPSPNWAAFLSWFLGDGKLNQEDLASHD